MSLSAEQQPHYILFCRSDSVRHTNPAVHTLCMYVDVSSIFRSDRVWDTQTVLYIQKNVFKHHVCIYYRGIDSPALSSDRDNARSTNLY